MKLLSRKNYWMHNVDSMERLCKSPVATSSGEPFVDPPKSANLAIVGL